MKIATLNIVTAVNILYYSGQIIIATLTLSSIIIISVLRKNLNESLGITLLIVISLSIAGGYFGNKALQFYLISKSKYPLVLKIICNVLGISRTKISTKPISIDLDQFIKDNHLSLTYYYVNNPSYPILTFNKNKIRYFTQEFDWKDLKWDFYKKSDGRHSIEVLEFRGMNQNNDSIKDRIEFDRIEARNHEIIILFIIHDLVFGKGLSRYY